MTSDRITLKDIYAVTDRIETKLDGMEIRVRTIEIWRANFMGKVAMVVAVATLFLNVSIEYFKEKVLRK